jgi:hypothetical protein
MLLEVFVGHLSSENSLSVFLVSFERGHAASSHDRGKQGTACQESSSSRSG